MGKRFAIVIGVAAAGVMALGAQTATAAPEVVKYDTKLTIVQDGGGNLSTAGEVRGQVVRAWATGGPVQAAARGGSQVRPCPNKPSLRSPSRQPGRNLERVGRPSAHGWQVYAEVRRRVRHGRVCLPDRSSTHRVY